MNEIVEKWNFPWINLDSRSETPADTVRTVLIFRGIWSSVETSKTISVGKWLRSIERRGFAQAKTITSSH